MNSPVPCALRAALGLLVCAETAQAADIHPASILAPVGQTVVYRSTFDGHFWNGEKRHSAEKVALKATAANAATISDLLTSGAAPVTAGVGRGGSLDVPAPTTIVFELNEAGALLSGLDDSPKAGSSWKSTIVVRTSPASTASVPVDVHVASVDANGVLLQATGGVDSSMTYSGMPLPVTLTVRIAELVGKGAVSRAQADITEHVSAGPFTQDMGWQWALVNDSAA